jgi:glucose-1-phosphate cytidylyltransferase
VNQDIEIDLEQNEVKYLGEPEKWNVLVSNTGLQTMTGGRIHKIKKYINEENFLCTYGDAVSDINIKDLYRFHLEHGKIATMMVVRQPSRFGVVELDNKDSKKVKTKYNI